MFDQPADAGILAGVRADMAQCAAPVREDLSYAHAQVLTRFTQPGAWWTGAQRIAIAAATRSARTCALCQARKAALSPRSVAGEHAVDPEFAGVLPAPVVDLVHFATNDAARMTRGAIEGLLEHGFTEAHYVEALGIAVALRSIDQACRGLGVPLHALPAPLAGAPSGVIPEVEPVGEAFVPMLPARPPAPPNEDLWDASSDYFGLRAMSLVPDAVRDLRILSAAQYLPLDKASDFSYRRALGREQMELLAARVSAINECFY